MTIKIEKQRFDNIATWMKSIEETKLPDILKGVFFMDGNPLPDDCITMYNVEWDAENRALLLPVFGPVQWTFHTTIAGWLLLVGAWLTRFSYKIQFEDETLKQAQIIPFALGIPIPKWIINATMTLEENSQNGNTWKRENIWFGIIPRVGNYTLRKIVDRDGNYTPAFQDMLPKVQSECWVVANDSTEDK